MADEIRSEIRIDIDTNDAVSSLKNLQRQISIFQRQMNTSTAANAAAAQNIQRNLVNTINATGQFSANIKTIKSTTESFTTALEKNKLSMGEYFRYAGGASKSFGKLFKQEFDTIQKVAESRVRTLQTQYIKLGRDANGAIKAISVRPLALDMENLATKTQIAAQRQALLNQLLKQGSTNLLNFGKNTQWAGRQLMVGFTIPLGILGAQASRTFMELEQQAIKFKRVYGDTFTATEETDAMLKQIKALASEFTKYGVAAQQTMSLAADAAASGKMSADLLAQVTEATRLSVLGNTEAAQALETTISVANAFGTAAEELAGKIDFLNAVENQTVTSIEDLTIAIPKAGPVVKQLGGDVEDLAFFLTAMKEGGINASEGANALKSGLASLINPTGKAAEMLASFGINIKNIVEANKGDVKGIVIDFARALDTLDPLSRARAIEQLFGKFQFSRLSTLFQNVVKEGTQASRVLELTKSSAAELALLSERELKRLEDSPMYKFQKAVEDLKVALAPVGEAFLKAITPVIEFGTQILKKFDELDQGTKSFVISLTTLLGGIGPIAIMTFGLLANGIAQIIKGFTFVRGIFTKTGRSTTILGESTEYMTQQQLEAAAVAASLDQTHSKLTQTFNVERASLDKLTDAYRRALAAQGRLNVGAIPTSIRPKKYASGVLSVPGPKGAGDIIPAMLSPGEAVIPAEQAQTYRGFIAAMIQGKIPGFAKGFLGMPKSFKRVSKEREAADGIFAMFQQSRFKNQKPEEYGHQISPTSGHSFPIFGLGGVYAKPDGSRVFVKPVMDETAALAEMRGTQIARDVHGLIAPQQRIVVMKDPTDLTGNRRFLALESPLDPRLAQPTGKFTKSEYITQLLASLLRGDKDLSAENLYGRVLADVGPAGVFTRASGLRSLARADEMPSLAQQAMINLLGVKGGAKKAFATTTASIARDMTATEFDSLMKAEIRKTLPRLKETVKGFGLAGKELEAYTNMIKRLEDGLSVDWRQMHAVHTQVGMPKKYNDGVLSVPGRKGAGDSVAALLAPGEAVIPADVASKNRGFISAMMNGKIPGFEDGVILPSIYQDRAEDSAAERQKYATIAKNVSKLTDRGFAVQAQQILDAAASRNLTYRQTQQLMRNMNAAVDVEDWTRSALGVLNDRAIVNGQITRAIKTATGVGLGDPRQRQFAHIGAGAEMMINGKMQPIKSFLGMDGIRGDINRQMNGLGAMKSEFLDDYGQLGKNKWNLSVLNAGGDLRQLSRAMTAFDKEVARLVRSSGAQLIFDSNEKAKKLAGNNGIGMDLVYAQARANIAKKYPELVSVLDIAHGKGKEYRKDGSSGKAIPKGFRDEASQILARQAAAEQGMVTRARNGRVTNRTGARVPSNFDVIGGAASDTRMVAVSPRETILTRKVGDRIKRGFSAMIPGLGIVGRVDGQPEGQTTGRVRVTPGGQFRDTQSNKRISRDEAQRLMRLDRQNERRRIKAEEARQLKARRDAGLSQTYGLSAKEFDKLNKEQQAKLRIQRKLAAAQEKQARIEATKARIADEQRVAEEKRVLAEKEEKRAARQAKAGKFGRVAGGAGTLGVAAASMMGGDIGAIASQALLPLMMLQGTGLGAKAFGPAIFPIAGFAALAASTYAIVDSFNKAKDKALEMGETFSVNSDAMKELSAITGRVSASDVMSRQRDQATSLFKSGINGEPTLGEMLAGSEAGKAMTSQLSSLISSGLDRATIADKFAMQLANAVSSGVLNGIEARALIEGLGQKLGDQALALSINGNLTKLIGANGENLLTEPFKMRVQLIAANQQRLGEASTDFANAEISAGALQNFGNVAGYGAAGSGIGATIGAIGGAFAGGPAGAAAGAVLGTQIGTAVGVAYGQVQNMIAASANLGATTGAFVANTKLALEGTQANLDAMDLAYQTKLKELEAAKDLKGIAQLTARYESERANALRLNAKNITTIEEAYNSRAGGLFNIDSTTMQNTADDALKKAFEGTDAAPIAAQLVSDINAAAISDSQKFTLKSLAASGQLTLGQTDLFLEMFGGSEEAAKQGIEMAKKFGAAFTGQVIDVASILDDKDARKKFILDVSKRDPQNALESLKFFQELAAMGGTAAEIQARITYYSDPTNYAQYKKQITEINALADAGKLDITTELQQKIGLDQVSFNQLQKNQEWFSKLKPEQKVTFMQQYITRIATITDDAARGQIAKDAQQAGITSPDKIERMFGDPRKIAEAKAKIAVEESKLILDALEAAGINTGGGGGGGGGGSPAIDYLAKVKAETAAMSREIKLLNKGYNPEFASFLANAEKSVRDIYMTEKNGKITLTQKGELLKAAYDNKVLKNFELGQKQLQVALNAQATTLDTLIAAGVDYKVAREAATNADIQAAVAAALTIKNDKLRKKALDEIAKALGRVQNAQEVMDWKDQQAAVKQDIQSARDQVAAYKKLVEAGMSAGMAYDIVGDAALAASIAQKATTADLNSFIESYKLLQAFQQQARNPLEVIIEGSQKQIDVYQSQMTSYQDALSKLQMQEDKINDQYDKRIEALEKVQEANREIVAQQKAQLDVADAITRGDIAAAARAVREAKAEATDRALEDQKDALKEARDAQVEALTITVNGQTLTIKQLNDKITALEGQILDERIKTLNPAQEKLAQQQLDNFVTLEEAAATIAAAPLSAVESVTSTPEPKPEPQTQPTPINSGSSSSSGNGGSGDSNNDGKNDDVKEDSKPTGNGRGYTQQQKDDQDASLMAAKMVGVVSKDNKLTTSADTAERKITATTTIVDKNQGTKITLPSAFDVAKNSIKAGSLVGTTSPSAGESNKFANLKPAPVSQVVKSPSPMDVIPKTTKGSVTTVIPVSARKLMKSAGGLIPKYMASGGMLSSLGSDTVPAMLTPGEFVVSKFGVEKMGIDNLKAINNGKYPSSSVYNYEVNVNVKSESNPDQIARAVLTQIKQIDAQRIRGNKL